MKKTPWITLLAFFLTAPALLSAQGLAVGARVGTLGLGGEVALGLSDVIVFRGGYGVFPVEYEGDFEGETYTVTFPNSIWSVGVDLYLGGGPIRIMGGIMGRSGDLEVDAEWTGSREIGGTTYEVPGGLNGVLKQKATAPFAGIGFGKHTSGGFGFFLDLAVAFTGEPDVELTPTGAIASEPGIQEAIDREVERVKEDAGSLQEYWPVVSLGFKLPLGVGY
jgi:hypothetical protein